MQRRGTSYGSTRAVFLRKNTEQKTIFSEKMTRIVVIGVVGIKINQTGD